MTSVGLVVPVYNEADRVGEYAPAIGEWCRGAPERAVVFVDDGSSDDTVARLRTLTSEWATVIERPHRGKGAAIAAGLRAVAGDVRAFCDLDLSTPLADLDRIVELAARAPVLAIGSRDVLGAEVTRPEGRVRETLGRTFNRWAQLLISPGVLDTQCGAKAARATLWADLLDATAETGFAWDAEIVGLAITRGIAVREVPVRWRHDERTRVKVGRDGVAMVLAAARIGVRLRRRPGRATALATTPSVGPDAASSPPRDHWWHRSRAALVATALRRVGVRGSAGRLVDVGAGTGATTAFLGWSPDATIAIERDSASAGAARRVGFDAVRAVAEASPLAPGCARVVTLLDVLEHHPTPVRVLRDAARVVADNGVVVVLVPAHALRWSRSEDASGHRRRYTKAGLIAELREAGLEPALVSPVLTWALAAALVLGRPPRPPAENVRAVPVTVDRLTLVLTSVERHLLGRVRLPPGALLLAVARPAKDGATTARR